MKNPGQLVRLSDGRLCIVDNKQPLYVAKGFMTIKLIGEDFKPLINDKGKPKILLRNKKDYTELMTDAKLVGHVD